MLNKNLLRFGCLGIIIGVALAIGPSTLITVTNYAPGQQAGVSIQIDSVAWVSSDKTIRITIRNSGTEASVITSIQITTPEGVTYSTRMGGVTINPGMVSEHVLGPRDLEGFNWLPGRTYTIKALTDTGFSTEGSYPSPG